MTLIHASQSYPGVPDRICTDIPQVFDVDDILVCGQVISGSKLTKKSICPNGGIGYVYHMKWKGSSGDFLVHIDTSKHSISESAVLRG